MKQGRFYNKIILGLLLLAVVLYIGYAVFSAVRQPLTTTRAIEYEAGEGCQVTGWVVRSEQVLSSPFGITVLERQEGEKVGTGQVVATGYNSTGAQARQEEIASLSAQLEQLSYAVDTTTDAADTAALDQEILAELAQHAQYVAQGDLSAALSQSTELKGLILRRSIDQTDTAAITAQMDSLEQQLTQLRGASGGDTARIVAPSAGYFSGTVDGYESVLTPELLETATIAQLQALEPAAVADNACGRLVTDATWYFAAAVPAGYLTDTEAGDTVTVSFAQNLDDTMSMTVTRIGDEEDGERLLVLQSSDYIQDVTLLRRQTADVVFRSYSGLRVPKEALRMNEEGQAGVYILESAQARWKPVTILYDNGESYVVELDRDSVSNLWPGDEIIVQAKNLYDGKVVVNE